MAVVPVSCHCGSVAKTSRQQVAVKSNPAITQAIVLRSSRSNTNPPIKTEIKLPSGNAEAAREACAVSSDNVSCRYMGTMSRKSHRIVSPIRLPEINQNRRLAKKCGNV